MRHKRLLLSAGLAALLYGTAGTAHHTASAFYDLGKKISVEGRVTGMKLANPHSYYRVTTDSGEDWAMEAGGSWTQLQKLGYSSETIPEGARVRVSGSPARDGKPIARYDTIAVYREDGGIDLYGGGRAAWAARARELGTPCTNGVADCLTLDAKAIETLQEEFGNVGVWSPLDE